MAYQDRFYTTGAVTVQNGSAVVTGDGTGWETALIDGGVIFVGGGSYPIYSVESEKSLTLAYPFTGVSGADLPYAIDRQRAAATSNIQMNDRLAQIIREISVGNIEQFNALTLEENQILTTNSESNLTQSDITAAALSMLALGAGANKMPYFTSANAAALTDLTSFARQLLTKTNASQMYALLGGSSGGGWERTPGGQLIQYGADAKTTNSAGGFSITLPTAYGAAYSYRPVIVNGNSNVGVNFSVWPEQTANAFSAVAKYADSGTPAVGILAQVNWLTIGV